MLNSPLTDHSRLPANSDSLDLENDQSSLPDASASRLRMKDASSIRRSTCLGFLAGVRGRPFSVLLALCFWALVVMFVLSIICFGFGASSAVITSEDAGMVNSRLYLGNMTRGMSFTPLWSATNPYGYINLVDPYQSDIFNPSLLILPSTVSYEKRVLFVGRGKETYEREEGGRETRWQNIFGCFMVPNTRRVLELPYLSRTGSISQLDLPGHRDLPFLRCREAVYAQFVGPEDPRFFLSPIGAPLLFYSQSGTSPGLCRTINVIDARMVLFGLEEAMEVARLKPPVEFNTQTELVREDQTSIEKNWAPFFAFPSFDNGSRSADSNLYFHVELVPQKIYKYKPNRLLRLIPELRGKEEETNNCLTEVVGKELGKVHFHQATPLLLITLCKRGSCKPNVDNTVLMGIIHIKYHPEPYLFYERRVVTLKSISPFSYISISPPLTYLGTNQADPIFTTSMTWENPSRHTAEGIGYHHGFLDDKVVISFGVADYGSAYIDVYAEQLLTDHTLCKDEL